MMRQSARVQFPMEASDVCWTDGGYLLHMIPYGDLSQGAWPKTTDGTAIVLLPLQFRLHCQHTFIVAPVSSGAWCNFYTMGVKPPRRAVETQYAQDVQTPALVSKRGSEGRPGRRFYALSWISSGLCYKPLPNYLQKGLLLNNWDYLFQFQSLVIWLR